jgi:hypothetical protein
VQSFVNNDCWSNSYPDLGDGGESANGFFTPSFVSAIGVPATPLGNGNCSGDSTGECAKWIARMTADWPHLTGAAATTPLLVWYANNDTTIPATDMQCVFNRLTADNTAYRVCYDPDPVGHSGSVSENSDYVADWIAQQTMGGAAPTEPCQALGDGDSGVPTLESDAGAVQCNDLLSNQ